MSASASMQAARPLKAVLFDSLAAAETSDAPYRHWLLSDVIDPARRDALFDLPFDAPDLEGVSGAREFHNETRQYVDQAAIASFPVCRDLAETFQDPETVGRFEAMTGSEISGCSLRIEYALDKGPFWLKPHTDIGVKKLTLLVYLPADESQVDLGTDIYADENTWFGRAPFAPGGGLLFIPANNTWHGFQPREIPGVRKSIIINYVTPEWRAREQLAYPETPVRAASSARTA